MTPRTPALRFALVAIHLLIAVLVWNQATHSETERYDRVSDPARYREIVTTPGTPYRDFDVEYPPLAVAVFKGLGPDTFDGFLRRLMVANMMLQALVALLLFRRWGRTAGFSYLALSAPLMPIVYTRFDLFVVAFAVVGASLAKRGKTVLSSVCWAAGAFVKLWPAALLGRYARPGRVRALAAGLVVGAAGLAAWLGWAGTDAFKQVLTFRGADGWHFESVPGSVLRLLSRGSLSFQEGAWRVGDPPAIVEVALAVATLGVVGWVWLRAAKTAERTDMLPEIAVVLALLVCGTLASPQLFVWVVPFVAIAAAAGAAWLFRGTAVVVGLTFLAWTSFDPDRPGALTTELLVLARNAAVVYLFVRVLRSVAAARENGVWSPAPSPEAFPTHPAPISSSTPKAG